MITRQTELADGLFFLWAKRNVFEHQVHGPSTRKNYGARDPGPGLFACWQMGPMLISVDFKSFLVADVGGNVTQVHSILCQKSYITN
jgi:hypothetical protein